MIHEQAMLQFWHGDTKWDYTTEVRTVWWKEDTYSRAATIRERENIIVRAIRNLSIELGMDCK